MNRSFLITVALMETALVAGALLLGAPTFTPMVVVLGTLFITTVTILTYFFCMRTVHDENPNRFVRRVMAATMIKFFLCVVGAGIFILSVKKSLNKPDLYLLMGIYFLFSMTEAVFLSQAARRKTN